MTHLFPRSKTVRGLIDCDSFFASCEVYRNPKLQGRPVCVGKQIVVAATYQAKSYGVTTGTPVREAKKILPREAVFCQPDFLLYGEISHQLTNFLRTQSNNVRPASIDEAFIDLTHQADSQEGLADYAEQLKHEIKEKVGIPVSIGIAPTKLLAKLGAGKNKPFGSCVMITDQQISTILTDTALSDIPYIGQKTAQKLIYFCQHAEQFRQLDYWRVKQLLGRSGCKLRGELNGYAINVRRQRDHQKAISRTKSFDPNFTSDPHKLWSYLVANIEKAYRALLDQGLQTKGVKVMLRTKSFHRPTRNITFAHHTTNKTKLLKAAKVLFTDLHDTQELYRSTGIYFFDLLPHRSHATSLFEKSNKTTQHKQLQSTIKKINEKWNRPLISSAAAQQRKRRPELFTL